MYTLIPHTVLDCVYVVRHKTPPTTNMRQVTSAHVHVIMLQGSPQNTSHTHVHVHDCENAFLQGCRMMQSDCIHKLYTAGDP